MRKYDDHLIFHLPQDYVIEREEHDQRIAYYQIRTASGTKGVKKEIYTVIVEKIDRSDSAFYMIKGNINTSIHVSENRMQVMRFDVLTYSVALYLENDTGAYRIRMNRAFENEKDPDAFERWVSFINDFLSCTSLDNVYGNYELITVKDLRHIQEECSRKKIWDKDFPIAEPQERQHTHMDQLGQSQVSLTLKDTVSAEQSGNECAFKPIAELALCWGADTNEVMRKTLQVIADTPSGYFKLSDMALNMAELFRVDEVIFNEDHDREQEILSGYIQKAIIYNALRSFAWTLAAYCDKNQVEPIDVDLTVLRRMIRFITEREGLNYTADSYSPVLCSGNDYHIYYLPDAVSRSLREKMIDSTRMGAERERMITSSVCSLERLRNELSYMAPAIMKIYKALEYERNRTEELSGGMADILYAWCSMTYAARKAFYSDDGPSNCRWDHPDHQIGWERRKEMDRVEQSVRQRRKWFERYSKEIDRGMQLNLKKKQFVFVGAEELEEWLEIYRSLTQYGGIYRTVVTEQTSYVICCPGYMNDYKLRQAIALRKNKKNRNLKIMLLEDYLKAVGITYTTPEERLEQLQAEKEAEEALKKNANPAERALFAEQGNQGETPFTYFEQKKAEGEGYEMEIPDGFVVMPGEENRDFIAYWPKAEWPDSYVQSDFVLAAGGRTEDANITEFKTAAECIAFAWGIGHLALPMYANAKAVFYKRKELPGVLLFYMERSTLYIGLFVTINDHIQSMYVRMRHVRNSEKAIYIKWVENLFNRMYAKQPIRLLKPLDEACFMQMVQNAGDPAEWIGCIKDYMVHHTKAEDLHLDAGIKVFMRKHEVQKANRQELLESLKDLMRYIGRSIEEAVVKAEVVYTARRSLDPEDPDCEAMKNAFDELIGYYGLYEDLCRNLIEEESIYEEKIKARALRPAAEAFWEMYRENDPRISEEGRVFLTKKEEERTAEERRKMEEARAMIEADRIARKLVEEEKEARRIREAEEKKAYLEAMETWKRDTENIHHQRLAYTKQKILEKKEEVQESQKQFHETGQEELKNTLAQAEADKLHAEQCLKSAGLFGFGKKKELKEKIEQLDQTIQRAKGEIAEDNGRFEKELREALAKVDTEWDAFSQEAVIVYPLPEEPVKPEGVLREEREKEEKAEAERRMRELRKNAPEWRFKSLILEGMIPGKRYSLTDIALFCPGLVEVPPKDLRVYVDQLKEEGDLKKEESRAKNYFVRIY